MSVDKLVDSTKLDACCTAEANAIRAKTGGSSQIAYDWANNKGFADAIASIPSGTTPTGTKQISITQNGTTTEDVAAYANAEITANVEPTYTALSAVSIVNNSTNGYINQVLYTARTAVKKFDIKYKLLDGDVTTTNDIVLTRRALGLGNNSAPMVGYKSTSSSGVTYTTKEIVDGYVHCVGAFNSAISSACVAIGAWGDSSYSKTNAFAYVKLYDASDNLLFDAIPVEDWQGVPAFYDRVSKQFCYLCTCRDMVAGEAV